MGAAHLGEVKDLSAATLATLPAYALYQLTTHARDRGYPLAPEVLPVLRRARLVDDQGIVPEAVKALVLAHVSGHGLRMEVSAGGKKLMRASAADRPKRTGLGVGAGRSKLALEAAWLAKVEREAAQPQVVAGALVDMARTMANSNHKFDAREMAKWTAAAATLSDAHGRVTPELQATVRKVAADHAGAFSKKAKALFQDLVAMCGADLEGPHQTPLRRSSYWIKGPQPLANFQSSPELPKEADIVIVGAGLTGASTAYHLAAEAKRQGKRVVVLEQYDPASGASGHNGGNFETLGEQFWGKYGTYDGVVAERFKFLKASYPDQPDEVLRGQAVRIAEVLTRFALRNAERMLKTIDEAGIDCDVSKSGWLRTALNPREEQGLLAQARLAKRLGAKIEVLTPERIARSYQIPTKFLGHVIYDNGNYHPGKLITGELERAIERGVQLYTRTAVRRIHSDRIDRHLIETDRGTVVAKRVVMATNAFTREVFPELSDIRYKRSQILTIEHAKDELGGITYTEKDGDLYVNLPRQDRYLSGDGQRRGTLLVGAGTDTAAKNPHRPRAQRPIFEAARRELDAAHPDVQKVPASRLWAGPMAFVEGERGMRMPVVGPLGKGPRAGIFLAVFCNGYGGGGCHNTGFNAAKWALSGKVPKEVPADVFSPARLFEVEPIFDTEKAAAIGRRAKARETNLLATASARATSQA